MADIKDYTGKITSQHSDKPKFMAMVEAVSQCFLDTNEVTAGLPEDFDLDSAVDAQLDDVGLWVGISRNIATPLTNVYFSLDTVGLGFDQGAWKGPFDPDNGITTLDNETYRTLLRAKIGANHWDGTLESSKAILDLVFNPDGHQPFFPVTANNEMFGIGDGIQTAFQLKYQGQNVYDYTSTTLYRNDWQGIQQLYQTPRTNLALRSQEFDNASWVKTRSTVSANVIVAPDGTLTADKLVTDTTPASSHGIGQNTGVAVAIGDTVTVSVFLKAAEIPYAYLQLRGGGGTAFVASNGRYFDIVNGVAGFGSAGSTYAIQDVGSGWFRVSHSLPATQAGTVAMDVFVAYALTSGSISGNGDGVSGFYPWGASVEVLGASTPKPYIPTIAAAVTVTDYVAGPFGQFTLANAPLPNAVLSWSGQGTVYANGNYAFMVDNQDMTITIGVAGNPPSAIQLALLTGGYITLKPQSVDISYYISPTISGPLFGFDASNQYIAGFDQGSWGKVYS